ncbi:MAG: hydantoinase B/oxoprolinase family protein, partial [Planctomycetota bacterium]|nr:hydantoinase B/oxoprolinase family protein [Planctomycetota bacterium]
PGPACYGAGGTLTITDANLLLGRLDPARFGIPIDRSAAERAATEVLAAVNAAGANITLDAMLEGFIDIADERMADAIRKVSVREGYDPADCVLVAFGGAGPQHAIGVARRLGVTQVLVPPDAGLLSARGLAKARPEAVAETAAHQHPRPLLDLLPSVVRDLEASARQSARDITTEETAEIDITRRLIDVRYTGQNEAITLEYTEPNRIRDDFERAHRAMYGHAAPNRSIEATAIRVFAAERRPAASHETAPPAPAQAAVKHASLRARFAGEWCEVAAFSRDGLSAGEPVKGPALIFERHSATVLDAGWSAQLDPTGAIILSAEETAPDRAIERPRAIRMELFTNRLAAIAREMGETLQRTSISINVKERLDFSCAILNARGELVVNAPHMPVHLGAMGLCVRALMNSIEMGPGDVVLTNHPAFGGSHLPDLTVVTPVFDDAGHRIGFTASRTHHAEIGGILPGSMPARSHTLDEEGVVIPPLHLIRAGAGRWDAVERILAAGRYPSRAVNENIADLNAAVAANKRGADALAALWNEYGSADAESFMESLMQRSEDCVRAALRDFGDRTCEAEERLDDGDPIRVKIAVRDGAATVDFTGAAPVHAGNLNGPLGVVRAATLYVLRLLITEPLPLNEGMLRAVDLRVPEGILNPPFEGDPADMPAVASGNVETSQRVVDTLLKALQLAACSQGTMNNVTFGNERYGVYETICGGSGAGP